MGTKFLNGVRRGSKLLQDGVSIAQELQAGIAAGRAALGVARTIGAAAAPLLAAV